MKRSRAFSCHWLSLKYHKNQTKKSTMKQKNILKACVKKKTNQATTKWVPFHCNFASISLQMLTCLLKLIDHHLFLHAILLGLLLAHLYIIKGWTIDLGGRFSILNTPNLVLLIMALWILGPSKPTGLLSEAMETFLPRGSPAYPTRTCTEPCWFAGAVANKWRLD